MRLVINGFGRIGRTVLRQILQDHPDIEVVRINDIAPLDMLAYLFRYDSVYGPFSGKVEEAGGQLCLGDRRIEVSHAEDLSELDLRDVDLVLECTGKASTRAIAERGLRAGAAAVLISGPSDAADKTLVLGVNAADLGQAQIVSNASCTTNAIAPLLLRVPAFDTAHITTIHCYTGSQPMVDMPRASYARSRAGAVSMVPTTTSAAEQVSRLLPHLTGRLSVTAVRVPTISVSAVDAVFQLSEPLGAVPNFDDISDDLIGVTDDPCVSSDMRARTESLVIARPETRLVNSCQLRVLGWYDNEWGFSARMIDMARLMTAR